MDPLVVQESSMMPRSRLNIKGLLDLDQMSAVLTGLIDQVDKQNKVINDLNSRLASFVVANDFAQRMSSFEKLISNFSAKMDALQLAATASVMNKKISAGDLASSNFESITHISKSLMNCVTKADAQQQQNQIDNINSSLSLLQRRFDKLSSMTDQLSSSHLQQGHRILNLESAVAGKIDRSEADHLQVLVSKVELYDDFKVNTIHAVTELQTFERRAIDQFGSINHHLLAIDDIEKTHSIDIGRAATKKEVHSIAKELSSQQDVLMTCARKSEVDQVNHALSNAVTSIEGNSQRIEGIEEDLKNLHTTVDGKATIAAVRNCVTRRHYEQAVAALGSAIDSKTPNTTTESLQGRIDTLDERLGADEEQLSVAVRFVDWFSSRGENYEHNMKIIDKHLKSLLTTSPNDAASKVHSYHLPNNRVIFQPESNQYGGK